MRPSKGRSSARGSRAASSAYQPGVHGLSRLNYSRREAWHAGTTFKRPPGRKKMGRTPPAPKKSADVSIMLAYALARKYARLGIVEYRAFQQTFNGGGATPAEVTSSAVSAATILGLSAELFAKTLVFQRLAIYPQIHNVRDVVEHLPSEVVASLSSRYSALLARKPNLLRFSTSFGGNASSGGRPAGRLSFDEALEEVSELFVRLRYLHESFDSGFAIDIDFHSPILIVESLCLEVDNHKGNRRFVYRQPKAG